MTLSYTTFLRLAVPDFLSEPWHSEFAAAMDSIDRAVHEVLILQSADLWLNSHVYSIGSIVVSPDNGSLYTAAVAHTSSPTPTTFTQEQIAHPTFWVAFAPTLASQAEAVAGVENTHYMSPLRVKEAISAQTFATALSTQGQAEAAIDNTTAMTPLRTQQQRSMWGVPGHGRLARVSATQLSFLPFGGKSLKINGAVYEIPTAGIVGLGNTGVFVGGVAGQNLAVNTSYFVYAFDNNGVVTVDFRTGTHETSSAVGNLGVETLAGDNTRSLIGLVRTNASAQFADSSTQRLVRSWFNRSRRVATSPQATGSTASTAFVAILTQLQFVLFNDEVPFLAASGLLSVSPGAPAFANLAGFVDGTFFNTAGQHYATVNGDSGAVCALTDPNEAAASLGEGYHTYQAALKSSAGTATVSFVGIAMVVIG